MDGQHVSGSVLGGWWKELCALQAEGRGRALTVRQALGLAAPHTWAASLCPALFGVLFCKAKGWELGLPKEVALVLACVLLQSAVNTLNDYFDFVKGADSPEDAVEVSDAVLVYGDLDPAAARNLGIAFLATGALLGCLASWGSGFLPIGVGLLGASAIFLYSGGPLPLSYLPVGEAVSGFVMGGLIPFGIAACTDGKPHGEILLWSLPLMLGIALIMMSNNGCDIEKDRRVGRHTLPVLLGRGRVLPAYRGAAALWILLLMLLPFFWAGLRAAAVAALVCLCGGGCFRELFRLRLAPRERISQMKGILACNLVGHGAYLAAFALGMGWGRG